MHHVYRIIDPRDNFPFYIGITKHPNVRYVQHTGGSEGAKAERIQSIRSDGQEPIFEVIESWEKRKDALNRESHWIQYYTNRGILLTNINQLRPVNSSVGSLSVNSPSLLDDIDKRWNDFLRGKEGEFLDDLITRFLASVPSGVYWPDNEDELQRETFMLATIATYRTTRDGRLLRQE